MPGKLQTCYSTLKSSKLLNDIQTMIILLFFSLTCGCANTYLVDRSKDITDILSFNVGIGYGAKVMIGPINTGFIENLDIIGIRDGVCLKPSFYQHASYTTNSFIFPIAPLMELSANITPKFGTDTLRSRTSGPDPSIIQFCNYYPFYSKMENDGNGEKKIHANQYYSQLEIVAGFIMMGRIGINPGEIIDFLIGIFGVDIYDDDQEGMRQRC